MQRTDSEVDDPSPAAQDVNTLLWLEQNSSEVQAFDQKHNAKSQRYFAAHEQYEEIKNAALQSVKRWQQHSAPLQKAGGEHLFSTTSEADGRWRVVTDAGNTTVTAEQFPPGSVLDWWYPSPNGAYIAVGISEKGDEQSVLHVWDVAANRLHNLREEHCSFSKIAWLPDESAFYYSGGVAPDHESTEKRLYLAKRGNNGFEKVASPVSDIVINDPYVSPHVSADGRYVALTWSWEKPATPHVFDTQTGTWTPFLEPVASRGFGRFVGSDFLLLTTDNAPRGRIIRVPLATHADQATWEEIVPESNAVVRSFEALPDGALLLAELVDGFSRLRVVQPSGAEHIIELPPFALISAHSGLDTSPFTKHGDELVFRIASFGYSAVRATFNVHTHAVTVAEHRELPLDISLHHAKSADGTEVPYVQISAPGAGAELRPTILTGYGGWNLLGGPFPLEEVAFDRLITAGGHVILAQLRGGGEFGTTWWEAGRREHKQNTFDDFRAVAEDVVQRAITNTDALAVWGRSNGGLLTAAAAVQFPQLLRAAITEVPLTDMARAMLHPYLASYREEYGDPEDPTMLEVLLKYSPVHNVKPGVAYPAVFALAGADDLRCQPWNAKKFVQLVDEVTTSQHPVLLEIAPGGHGGDLTTEQHAARVAHLLTFLFTELPFPNPLSLQ